MITERQDQFSNPEFFKLAKQTAESMTITEQITVTESCKKLDQTE